MDDLILIQQLQKKLKASFQNVGDVMISGGIDNMDKYKYLLGQAHAYQYTLQEISNLLNKKEQMTEKEAMTIQTSSNLNQEVPKIKLGLQDKYNEESKQEETKAPTKEALTPENIQGVVDELPEPSGWRILVLPFTPKEKTKGGLIIAQESLDRLRIATNCGYVLKMGPLAYKDKDKFDKPWCKEKDWVIFARYAGSRLPIEGGEIRILNDDEVLGTIQDPESVLHYI
jgi:co-chaperonin GroES (HSP10)